MRRQYMYSAIRKAFTISLAIVALAGFQFVDAQPSGGIHSIRGKIYLPNGRALETTIKIELQSNAHPTKTVYTDSAGSFAFLALEAGSYTVVVDAGDAFEVARESFLIDKEVQNRTFRINPIAKNMNAPIYLRAKQNDPLRNEVINAKFASFPKAATERYQLAIELVRAGKDEEAAEEFRAALREYPRFAAAHSELGKIYIRSGKYDLAVESFRSAISLEPADFDAHLNCGIALLNKRSLEDAQTEFDRASVINQSAVTPHFYLGLVYVQKRDLDKAQKKFEFARELTGATEFPLIHKYLGGIYWQKGSTVTGDQERRHLYRQAVDELEKYVKLLPTASDAKKIRQTITELRTKMG